MKTMMRPLTAGMAGLALLGAAVFLMSSTTTSASTMPAEVVADGTRATPDTFDPDVAASASGVSQQLRRALQYQQYQRQLAKQQQQFQQWRQGRFGQAMAATAGSTTDEAHTASAFDPAEPNQGRHDLAGVVYTVQSKPLPKPKGRLIWVRKTGNTTQMQ